MESLARLAKISENVPGQTFNSDVGTTSSGDDLAGMIASSLFTSDGEIDVNSESSGRWWGRSDDNGVGQRPSRASLMDLSILRTLLMNNSARIVQKEASPRVDTLCNRPSPCRRVLTTDHVRRASSLTSVMS